VVVHVTNAVLGNPSFKTSATVGMYVYTSVVTTWLESMLGTQSLLRVEWSAGSRVAVTFHPSEHQYLYHSQRTLDRREGLRQQPTSSDSGETVYAVRLGRCRIPHPRRQQRSYPKRLINGRSGSYLI
jgi:hypothetical protein